VDRNTFGVVVSIAGRKIIANTRNRIQAISIEGKLCDRYFAMASEHAKNTVDPMIKAMPRNGRSARAGAERLSALVRGADSLVNSKAGICGLEIGLRCCEGSNQISPDQTTIEHQRQQPKTGPGYACLRGGLPHFRSEHRQAIRLGSERKYLFDQGDLIGAQGQFARTGIIGRVGCCRCHRNCKHTSASR
jgi:hypothetical protein